MVILDTNILIDHLRLGMKHSVLNLIFKKYKLANLSISIVTIQELFTGASSRQQENQILELVASLKIWPYTHDVARLAGEIDRDLIRKIEFADAAIAATAVTNNAQLATLNPKHFRSLPGLNLLPPVFKV